MFRRVPASIGCACLATVLLGPASPAAEPPASAYRVPRGPLARLADVPGSPWAEAAPDGRAFVVLHRPGLLPVADLDVDERRLAADLWVEAEARAVRRTPQWSGLTLVTLPDGAARPVAGLPDAPRLGDVAWSPDGRTLAFTHTGRHGVELWLVDAATARARRVPRLRLSAVFTPSCHWRPDSAGLVCRAVPEPAPRMPSAPAGPRVEEAGRGDDDASEAFDARVFEALALAQVVRVRLDGRVTRVGAPDVISRAEPSPDGRHLLVESHPGPLRAALPIARQARRVEVWRDSGGVLARLAAQEAARALPAGADVARPGPRVFAWRADAPATLAWSEAEDGPDASDRVLALEAPFDGAPRTLVRGLRGRVSALGWIGARRAVATAESAGEGRLRRYVFDPDVAGEPARLVDDLALDGADGEPGVAAARPGTSRLLTPDGGRSLFILRGPATGGVSRLDRQSLEGAGAASVWISQPPRVELPVALLDSAGARLLTRCEAPDQPAAFCLHDLGRGTQRTLAPAAAPPDLPELRHELLRFTGPGGAESRADLTLPAAWRREQGPLPVLVWIYPDRRAAGGSGAVYSRAPLSPLDPRAWAYDGYAVLEPAAPPPASADGPHGDAFVAAVAAGIEAAVDELARRGVGDRARLALGGHSFGASMAALVLARGGPFRCGVALAGAYNRTLTPFGFQGETRPLWRAPQVYLDLSALLRADRLRTPLLLVHGLADRHPATPPEQSERLYAALRGLGAPARLVLLPREGHVLRGRASALHALAEIQDWLGRWLSPATDSAPR